MHNIMRTCNRAGKEREFPACHQETLEGKCSFPASRLLAWSSNPPQHSGGPTSTHCPSDCASPYAWESAEGGGRQRGRALQGTAHHWLLWLFLQPTTQASSQPSLRQCLCLPLGLPPRKEGLPTLKALCVGLAGRPLVGTGRLDNHRWHLDQVQGALVIFQGLSQI